MPDRKDQTVVSLVDDLIYQKPGIETTISKASCGRNHWGRGGRTCADCIVSELKGRVRRGGVLKVGTINAFVRSLDDLSQARELMQSLREELYNA